MKSIYKLVCLFSILLLVSCGQFPTIGDVKNELKKKSSEKYKKQIADSIANSFVTKLGTEAMDKDTSHNFVRSAEIKFRVGNVVKASYIIEEITYFQGGFVLSSNLTHNINYQTELAEVLDTASSKSSYIVRNLITLKVPSEKLDTTLKLISHLIEYLDYKILKVNDVALKIMENNLAQKRSLAKHGREPESKFLNETGSINDPMLGMDESYDKAKLANLALKEDLSYSTIKISIYER